MKINLKDFFKYYDEKNPKHVAAIEQLSIDIEKLNPDLLDDKANWVRIYRTKPEVPKTSKLDVPFYPQTDNYRDANRTCNSSSCAMCLEYFKPGTLKGTQGDDDYIRTVFSIGDTTDHTVQTRALLKYGVHSVFSYNLGFDDLDAELAAGRPVVIGILHRGSLSYPTGGHMIVVIGKTDDGKGYYVNDPYGDLYDGYTGPVEKGKGAIYEKYVLEKRWTTDGPKTGWGRKFI